MTTIDLAQFHALFFEEALEHLASMETVLLDINVDDPDDNDLNAIFRAAHSIKGASAIFGFHDIAGVTHVLESQLDRLRVHQCPLNKEMVDVFLRAGDFVKLQIYAHRRNEALEPAEAEAVINELVTFLDGISDREISTPAEPVASGIYRLTIDKHAAGRVKADLVAPLLAELALLGELIHAAPLQTGVLPITFSLRSSCRREVILDVMSFVLDVGEIGIIEEHQGQPATPSDTDALYGFFEALDAGMMTEAAPAAGVELAAPPTEPGLKAPRHRNTDRAPDAVAESSIRVGVDKVDQLINLVGELVITQAMLAQSGVHIDPVLHERLHGGLAMLERNTRDLQESVMSIRMMPISFVFNRFPRMVRDLAAKLNKEVELITLGEGTELDRGLIEKIVDPLTHLVRNSIDHGIETPALREAAGKQRTGVLTLRAAHQGGNILIEVEDNGAGLNRERILARAMERGLEAGEGMTDSEVWQLIFAPGFSTADEVTDVSGRGVGMDVVKRNIDAMGGRVDISTQAGAGTRISIRLPLTLAILDGMSVGVGDQSYILPLAYVVESLRPAADDIRSLAGRGQVVQVRGEHLPLVPLHQVFGIEPRTRDPADAICVIVDADGVHAALLVDELIGQQQVVIKNLETNYRKVPGVAGATIMGDGRVALILDLAGVVRMAQGVAGASVN